MVWKTLMNVVLQSLHTCLDGMAPYIWPTTVHTLCAACVCLHQINAIHTVYFLYVLVTYCVEYNKNPLEDTKHNRVILSRAEQALAYAGWVMCSAYGPWPNVFFWSRPWPNVVCACIGAFSFLYFKKIKFQKYMPNRKTFKNGCLSPP